MQLSVGGVSYEGPTSLVQFVVTSTKMVLKDPKYLVVEITLKRMFKYHLAATFVPTTLLMIVTEITLFVDEKHFEATIMVHLTTMLVMYTLYQGVSASMPKTAYLKFIDIWLLYGLTIPFITFVVETLLRLLSRDNDANEAKDEKHVAKVIHVKSRNKTGPININHRMYSGINKTSSKKAKLKTFLQYSAQILIPLVTGLFIAGYTYLALTFYHD